MQTEIVLLGDGGVGKTSFIRKLTGNFEKKYTPTNSFETIEIKTYKFYDYSGQEMFVNFGNFHGVNNFLIFFDKKLKVSHKGVRFWVDEIEKVNPDASIVIVCNKIDLPGLIPNPIVNKPYLYLSSKTGQGIYDVLECFDNSM
uniref:Ras family GTPase n=1 Tax=Pithovirus LCDPAC01 TaxID=2506600 RepID=A0A4D5XEL1_9VIRU|nr:MAG: Ras family GTPase [Pithovirus LCDPAC01]